MIKLLRFGFICFLVISSLFLNITSKKALAFDNPAPVTKKVLVLDFDPYINGVPLHTQQNWGDPLVFQVNYAADILLASHGYANYNIVETQVIRDYPIKEGGFKFNQAGYLNCLATNGGPEGSNCRKIVDYPTLITDYNICTRINSGEIHEVWLWGGPWFGYWEAVMGGPNAIDTNGPKITGTSCTKDVHFMGFSYEADYENMLHDFGHRVEGTMEVVHNDTFDSGYQGENSLPTNRNNGWVRYYLWDKAIPGQSGCGNLHNTPNETVGYNRELFDLPNSVLSHCPDFANYPSTTGQRTPVDGTISGPWGGTALGFYKWWLGMLPTKTGTNNEIRNNWWNYVLNYSSAIVNPSYSEKWYTITASANDWEVFCGTGIIDTNNTTLNLGFFGNGCDEPPVPYIKFKFPNVKIPKGAVITDAYLEFISANTNPKSIRDAITLTNGTYTTTPLTWNYDDNGTVTKIHSPSLIGIAQSLINHTSWNTGDYITVSLNPTVPGNGSLEAWVHAYDGGHQMSAPRLVITATAP